MGDGIVQDVQAFLQLQRYDGLLARRQFKGLEKNILEHLLQIFREVHLRTEKELPHVFQRRQLVGIVARNRAHPRGDGKRDFDHLVECGFVTLRAEGTHVFIAAHRLQGGVGIEHSAAGGTQHIPRHIENADFGGMQKCGDHRLFIEFLVGREGKRIHSNQPMVGRIRHKSLDRDCRLRLGRLAQQSEH